MTQNPYSGYQPPMNPETPRRRRTDRSPSFEGQMESFRPEAPQSPAYEQPAARTQPGYQPPPHQPSGAAYRQPGQGSVPPTRPARPRPAAASPGSAPQAPVSGEPAESYFDGTLLRQIGYSILVALVVTFTLGLAFPWAECKLYGWKVKHTVIEGKRLSFDGKGSQLFGKWILWMLLCVVTLGIYSFWVGIALEKWRVKHTHFAR